MRTSMSTMSFCRVSKTFFRQISRNKFQGTSERITFTMQLFRLSAVCLLLVAPAGLFSQVRKLHTRDLTRLSQVQVVDYLKRSDIIFIPVGAVETNGIM